MISEKFKTPYFLIDKQKLDYGLEELKRSLESAWGNYIIGYSYKTNPLPWIIRYMKEKGCHAEVVSEEEYLLARKVGAGKRSIIYNGIAKSKDTFLEAVKNGAFVNIDAEYEIDWLDELEGSRYEIGIRANFDLERMCPGQAQGGNDGSRFGFLYENGELKRAIDRIQGKGLTVAGLHLHKSSKTRMPEIYRAITETAVDIACRYDLDLKYVDIGGGFFGGLEDKPSFDEYFAMAAGILRKKFRPEETVLIVEPGISLIGVPIEYVTTVLDIKRTASGIFVVTDGSRIHIDPLMGKQSYCTAIDRVSAGRREIAQRQVITGFTCMEQDRIFEITDSEELKPGDRITYKRTGAYTMCLSPLFIKWFPGVYVTDGNQVSRVRDGWTEMEYMSGSRNG